MRVTKKGEPGYQSWCNVDRDGNPNLWLLDDSMPLNYKDQRGKAWSDVAITAMVFLGIVILCLLLSAVLYWRGSKYQIYPVAGVFLAGALALSLGLYAIAEAIDDPMNVVYAVSYHVKRRLRYINEWRPVYNPQDPEYMAADVVQDFKQNYAQIRTEVITMLDECYDQIPLTKDTKGNDYIGRDVKGGDGWRVLQGWILGSVNPGFRERCPALIELINRHTDKIAALAVSVLPPNTEIPPHVGYFSGIARLMIPLQVPQPSSDVFLCVNEHTLNWEEGVAFGFDDTFPHSVRNQTRGRRVVLYLDIIKDLKSGWRNALLGKLIRLAGNADYLKAEVARTEIKRKIVGADDTPATPGK